MYMSGDINVATRSEYSGKLCSMMETLVPTPDIRQQENGAIQEGMETANKLALEIFQDIEGRLAMNTEGVLVSFKLDGNKKTNETSGILFNKNTVLISGTCLIPFVHQKKWVSSFLESCSSEIKPNEHIQKIPFRVFIEEKGERGEGKVGKELYCVEGKATGVWKCPLVEKSLKKLFCEWSLGHGNFDYESRVLSRDDIDLSKELMSVFILLRCEGRGEAEVEGRNNIRVLVDLMLSLQKPRRGQEVEVVSTPFGNEHFINSLSRGLISNVVGCENCIILCDARTVSGCEGGPIFVSHGSRESLLGIVTCPLTWWRGEWVGFTIGITLFPVLEKLLTTKNINPTNKSNNFSTDLLGLDVIDETVVLVRSKTSWGSGVVVNAASGIVITCSHVVKDNDRVTIFHKGNQHAAHVVFKSSDDIAYDLAIIKTENSFKKEVKFSENSANVGELVIAAGFPFFSEREDSYIKPSIASGCISRINPYMIQTTCCIQSGFSGGGLFRNGQLLGIVISNVKDSNAGALFPHINFIVPSSVFKENVLKFIKTNDVRTLCDLECSDIKVQALWGLQTSKL